ncbi:MAG: hypothetical protein F2763_00460 [Actinobacteria bacterium]|uniref:Unannotated protein n=1 Tax=freshwater metagenome TaxID=449393 RepID=A0A6J6ZHM8_9ZZZZ|nr:hypothetical protein [Actinomycetota bacterium]
MHGLILPRLGQTMAEGLVTAWLVDEGSSYAAGTPLYEVETEKVTTLVEATLPGTLLKILVGADSIAVVGTLLAVAADPGEIAIPETTETFIREDNASRMRSIEPESWPSEDHTAPTSSALETPTSVRAMPRTRKLAHDSGIELDALLGTGTNGLVLESQVANLVTASASAGVEFGDRPVASGGSGTAVMAPPEAPRPTRSPGPQRAPLATGVQQRERRLLGPIARRMSQVVTSSWSQVPQFTQFITVDATAWQSRREALRSQLGVDIGYTDMILDAVLKAAQEVPEANSSFDDEALVLWRDVNISIAVDSPAGLVVPVLRTAQDFTLEGRARRTRELVDRAKSGTLTLDDVTAGTITVSNLGMYGIEGGVPLVTAPQATIVFLGAVREVVVPVDGGIGIRKEVSVAVSFDHRAIDGATGARFTAALGRHLEMMKMAPDHAG